mmetsp:Transcript_23041/g.48052  ORF Transcript_23041/g.48052 Transcript_23041/m.48052 type:complete len:81 (-) Transcript_23041:268-510(-)
MYGQSDVLVRCGFANGGVFSSTARGVLTNCTPSRSDDDVELTFFALAELTSDLVLLIPRRGDMGIVTGLLCTLTTPDKPP